MDSLCRVRPLVRPFVAASTPSAAIRKFGETVSKLSSCFIFSQISERERRTYNVNSLSLITTKLIFQRHRFQRHRDVVVAEWIFCYWDDDASRRFSSRAKVSPFFEFFYSRSLLHQFDAYLTCVWHKLAHLLLPYKTLFFSIEFFFTEIHTFIQLSNDRNALTLAFRSSQKYLMNHFIISDYT